MKYVVSFLRFWYNFIIGDDWLLAAGVVVGFWLGAVSAPKILTVVLLPLAIITGLALSLLKATRSRR